MTYRKLTDDDGILAHGGGDDVVLAMGGNDDIDGDGDRQADRFIEVTVVDVGGLLSEQDFVF
ncbi:MAG: hypothetical protein AAF416_18795 [Pseudomonadota bacterium]